MTTPKRLRNNKIRALKACESCRRQKARCFPSDDPNGSCLRCLSVGRDCSFLVDGAPPRVPLALGVDVSEVLDHDNAVTNTTSNATTNAVNTVNVYKRQKTDDISAADRKRIKETHANVKKIIQLLETKSHDGSNFNTRNTIALKSGDFDTGDVSISVSPAQSSPFQVIRSSVNPSDLPSAIENILSSPNGSPLEEEEPPNVLSLGIINITHATTLVERFKKDYGKWISFPSSVTTEEYISELKFKCPILLTVICLISLRFRINTSRVNNEESLQRQLSIRLSQELKEFLISPNEFKSFDFLKALVILSVNGLSLTNQEINIDPWFLSGLAIQWFLTLDINKGLLVSSTPGNEEELSEETDAIAIEEERLSNFRIWNHLCLVHLSNCIFSGRMCVLDEVRINQTRNLFALTETTHFDGRMIAEISLQLLLYNFIQSTTIRSSSDLDAQFETFEDDIKQWLDEWNYLTDQPEEQYLDLGYHYSYVAALYHLKLGNTSLLNVKVGDAEDIIQDFESLNKILYHSLRGLNHILKENDIDSFTILSDQIHFFLFYLSIIFLKIIRWIDIVDKGAVYNKEELVSFIGKVESIERLFSTISKVETDLAHKYSEILQSAIQETREFVNV